MSQVLKRVTRKSDSFEAKNKERKGGSSLLHSTINMKKKTKTTPHIDLLHRSFLSFISLGGNMARNEDNFIGFLE